MLRSSRGRRRLLAASLLAGGLAAAHLAFGAPAYAGSSVVFSEDLLTVRFDAFGPSVNDVTIVEGDGFYTLTDAVTPILPGEGCSHPGADTRTVVCVGIDLIVNLWGGDDTLDVRGIKSGVLADLGAGDDEAVGSPEWDSLSGGPGNDVLNGAGGDDSLTGSSGADELIGGPGFDSTAYNTYKVPVKVDLDGAVGDDGAAGEGDTTHADIEGVSGGFAADELTGGPGRNFLGGNGGNDRLDARDGAGGDSVNGGTGKDTCLTDAGDVRFECP